jgi:hypothetical protein
MRSELASTPCEACGNVYAESRLRVLARRQGLYVVGLTCVSCGAAALAMVSFGRDGGRDDAGTPEPENAESHAGPHALRADRLVRTRPSTVVPPVDLDDVLDMHRFLEDFDGDFRGLFDTTLGGSSLRGRGA